MSLTTASLAGLVFASSERDGSAPLDFVLVGPTGVIVASIGWWQDPNGWADRVVFLHGAPVDAPTGWSLKRNDTVSVWFASPDTEEQARIDLYRVACDIRRADYLQALDRLTVHLLPEFRGALAEWIALIKARPVIDPLVVTMSPDRERRKVGVVLLSDGTCIVDALVLDRDEYAVALGDDWLESIGEQYAASAPAPNILDFLDWVKAQRTVGTLFVSEVKVIEDEGPVEGIALRCVGSTI